MENKREFDVKTLLRVLISFWLVIAVATAAAGALGGVYSYLADKPIYRAYASFWVQSGNSVNQSSTLGAAQLATNYTELADSTTLLTRAVKDGNLADKWGVSEDVAVDTLGRIITAGKADENSVMFTVYATSGSRAMTFDAISAVQESMIKVIDEVNGDTGVVRVAEVISADYDVSVSSESRLKKVLIGAVAGFVISYLACFLYYVYGKKIKRTEQLHELTDTDVVGLPEAFYNPRRAEKISPAAVMHAYLNAGGLVRNSLGDENGVIALTTSGYADPDAALSIGESYAAAGKRVLVVECDARLPLLLDMLEGDKEGTVGLDAFLCDGTAPTVINIDDDLDVITVGAPSDGYLSTHALRGFAESVRDGYDIVILSLPPASLLVDVVDLATVADRAALVVTQGDEIKEVGAAIELLSGLGLAPSAVYFLPL